MRSPEPKCPCFSNKNIRITTYKLYLVFELRRRRGASRSQFLTCMSEIRDLDFFFWGYFSKRCLLNIAHRASIFMCAKWSLSDSDSHKYRFVLVIWVFHIFSVTNILTPAHHVILWENEKSTFEGHDDIYSSFYGISGVLGSKAFRRYRLLRNLGKIVIFENNYPDPLWTPWISKKKWRISCSARNQNQYYFQN